MKCIISRVQKNIGFLVVFSMLFSLSCNSLKAGDENLDSLYRSAQRYYWKKNYKDALPLLEKFLTESKAKKHKRERLIWVIDQIGRIHLRVNKNPDNAILFFEKLILNDDRLTEAEENDIGSWIVAAKDWKKNPITPSSKMDELNQFKIGKEYFQKAKKKIKYPADDSGNAYFLLASKHLVPFINKNDHSAKISEALLMMGEVRMHLRTDPEYWSENFYLKEVIRRFPHSVTSQKAYALLEDDVRFGYSGSSGDNTPPSVLNMLKSYKAISSPVKKKSNGKKK